jgi:hypothetical protein
VLSHGAVGILPRKGTFLDRAGQNVQQASQSESIDRMLPSKELFDRQDIATAGSSKYSARKTLHLKRREPAASPFTK